MLDLFYVTLGDNCRNWQAPTIRGCLKSNGNGHALWSEHPGTEVRHSTGSLFSVSRRWHSSPVGHSCEVCPASSWAWVGEATAQSRLTSRLVSGIVEQLRSLVLRLRTAWFAWFSYLLADNVGVT